MEEIMSNEMAGVTPEQVERIAAIVAREVVGKLGKELREEIGGGQRPAQSLLWRYDAFATQHSALQPGQTT